MEKFKKLYLDHDLQTVAEELRKDLMKLHSIMSAEQWIAEILTRKDELVNLLNCYDESIESNQAVISLLLVIAEMRALVLDSDQRERLHADLDPVIRKAFVKSRLGKN